LGPQGSGQFVAAEPPLDTRVQRKPDIHRKQHKDHLAPLQVLLGFAIVIATEVVPVFESMAVEYRNGLRSRSEGRGYDQHRHLKRHSFAAAVC
jgi:hypothetical protein